MAKGYISFHAYDVALLKGFLVSRERQIRHEMKTTHSWDYWHQVHPPGSYPKQLWYELGCIVTMLERIRAKEDIWKPQAEAAYNEWVLTEAH